MHCQPTLDEMSAVIFSSQNDKTTEDRQQSATTTNTVNKTRLSAVCRQPRIMTESWTTQHCVSAAITNSTYQLILTTKMTTQPHPSILTRSSVSSSPTYSNDITQYIARFIISVTFLKDDPINDTCTIESLERIIELMTYWQTVDSVIRPDQLRQTEPVKTHQQRYINNGRACVDSHVLSFVVGQDQIEHLKRVCTCCNS